MICAMQRRSNHVQCRVDLGLNVEVLNNFAVVTLKLSACGYSDPG